MVRTWMVMGVCVVFGMGILHEVAPSQAAPVPKKKAKDEGQIQQLHKQNQALELALKQALEQAKVSQVQRARAKEALKRVQVELDKQRKLQLVQQAQLRVIQAKLEASEAQQKALRDRTRVLEKRLQEAVRALAQAKVKGAPPVRAGANPPARNIEGKVAKVDGSGLLLLTVGADAGLRVGQTLELFRLNEGKPARSKYLGKVRIVTVTPRRSIAKPMGRLTEKAKAGDRVATQLRGRKP